MGIEDFWIVTDDGDAAVAESKGVGTNVRNAHVNQVDDHREEIGGHAAELPGLLVVNTFRNDNDLARRSEEVSDRVIRRARSSNVLVLRGFDLFNLLALKLSGEDVGDRIIEGLTGGGGWLEAADGVVTLYDGTEDGTEDPA